MFRNRLRKNSLMDALRIVKQLLPDWSMSEEWLKKDRNSGSSNSPV